LKISKKELTGMIDSTNVKAVATQGDIESLCREAIRYNFLCVCVNPIYVKLASMLLKKSNVRLSSTVGFPFGVSLPETKKFEAARAVEDGANELDMVLNLGALKTGNYDAVKQDIAGVLSVKHLSKGISVKVIIETACLAKKEKIRACELAKAAGADFVKTSTGFFDKGATVDDVKLMRQTVGRKMGVKAAGGIRTYEDAVAMVKAGANRIGTSSAVEVINGAT
jgi:deoxyribose-phosphate aldolase